MNHMLTRPRGSIAPAARHLRFALLLTAFLLVKGAPAIQAQETVVVSDSLVEVRLTDGSVLFGRVRAVEDDRITLETQSGARVELRRAEVRRIQQIRGRLRNGEVWNDDPHDTRLFFAPTGRTLDAGEGYFGVYELFFPFLTFGLSDRLVLTGGTPIIPGAIGEFAYLGPKFQLVRTDRMQLSAGVFAGIVESAVAGVAYGVGTWGDSDGAVSAGAGFGFWASDGESGASERPLLMLGGEKRTGRRTKFLTENYFVPGEEGAIVSAGIRFWGERLSADAGLGAVVGGGCGECIFPLVNFVYSFGGAR